MSSEIKVGVSITDGHAEGMVKGQLGAAIAFEAGHAHIEGMGFHPSDAGARALGEMLRDLGDAVLAELVGTHEHRVRVNPLSSADRSAPKPRAFNPHPR